MAWPQWTVSIMLGLGLAMHIIVAFGADDPDKVKLQLFQLFILSLFSWLLWMGDFFS